MFIFVLAALGVAALALHVADKPGTRAFDWLPADAAGKTPAQKTVVTASKSGRTYKVTSWPPNAQDVAYYVAEMKGPVNTWIGYAFNRKDGSRTFVRGHADSEKQLALMLADFNVKRKVPVV